MILVKSNIHLYLKGHSPYRTSSTKIHDPASLYGKNKSLY